MVFIDTTARADANPASTCSPKTGSVIKVKIIHKHTFHETIPRTGLSYEMPHSMYSFHVHSALEPEKDRVKHERKEGKIYSHESKGFKEVRMS